jgi:hypothetical protein
MCAEIEYYSRLLDDEFDRMGLEGNKRSAPMDEAPQTATKRRRLEHASPDGTMAPPSVCEHCQPAAASQSSLPNNVTITLHGTRACRCGSACGGPLRVRPIRKPRRPRPTAW